MTGHSEQPERAQPVLRPQGAAVQAYDEEEAPDPDHDRIEIPAFLRRQAN
jgi:cell division protein FtsZ